MMFLLLLLPFIIYKNEIINTPKYFKKLSRDYDSLSRLIYCGSKPQGIADFHLKMAEGKIKTILGRITDSSDLLSAGVSTLEQAARIAKEGVEQETAELHQVATAVEEMVATIDEVAQNTTFTSQKVNQAHSDCEIATKAMHTTTEKVNILAEEVANSVSSATELASEVENLAA